MKRRGAVIIIRDNAVALIRRVRGGRTYYLFPGGGVEPGETVEEAAVREAYEELGLHVTLDRLAAVVERNGALQYYFFATVQGGEFGTGTGAELGGSPDSERGSYTPCWLALEDLLSHDVRPRQLARALQEANEAVSDLPLRIVDDPEADGKQPA